VLDLACGTGLVIIPAAKAVGSSGTVIGIDITPGMLREAGNKTLDEGCAKIEWIEHDVTPLKSCPERCPTERWSRCHFMLLGFCLTHV
jgi:ubiquinone/menaquinone biosynthesis C-methylase UbiE